MPGSPLRTRLRLFARDLVVDRLAGRLGSRLVRLPGRSGRRRVIVLAETVDNLLADRSVAVPRPAGPDADSPWLNPHSEPQTGRASGLPRWSVSGSARRVTVVVVWWVAPWRDWDGRPWRLAGATRARVRVARRGRGTIRVDVRADLPISLATAIDAARDMIRPHTPLPADSGDSVAATARGGGPLAGRPDGVGSGDEGGVVVEARVEPAVLAEATGATRGLGLGDLRAAAGGLGLDDTRGAVARPVLVDFERVNPRGRRAEAYRVDAPRFVLLVDSSGSRLIPESGFNRAPWTWPGRPAWRELTGDLDWRTVTALRSVGVIECGQLSGVDAAAQAALVARLAMTGVVLHTTEIAPAVADRLAPELAAILTEPLSSVHAGPFDQEVRSVRQRRAALREHSVQFGRTGHPAVSAILTTRRTEYLPSILRAIAEQTYPYLEIVLCLHGIGLPAECADYLAHCGRPVEIISAPAEMIFGIALGLATRRASGDLVTKFDDDDDYGPEHVWDLVLARAYSGATLVGKGIEFVHLVGPDITLRRRSGQPEAETDVVAGGTMLIGRSDLAELGGWQPVSHSVDQALLDRVNRAGAPVYRTHPFGYLYYRRESGHTWAADDAFFLRTAYQKWPGRPALPELTRT